MVTRFGRSAGFILQQLRPTITRRTFSQQAAAPVLTEEQLRNICLSKTVDYNKAIELIESRLLVTKGPRKVSAKEVTARFAFQLRNETSSEAFFKSLEAHTRTKHSSLTLNVQAAVPFTKYR